MQNPDVKKRLKAFDYNISTKIANKYILADSEDPPEGWHLDAGNIDDPHLSYRMEAKITEADEYNEEALEKYFTA